MEPIQENAAPVATEPKKARFTKPEQAAQVGKGKTRKANKAKAPVKPAEPRFWAIVQFKASKKSSDPMAYLANGKVLFPDTQSKLNKGCKAQVGETWVVTYHERPDSNVVLATLERRLESSDELNAWFDSWDKAGQSLEKLGIEVEVEVEIEGQTYHKKARVSFDDSIQLLIKMFNMGAIRPLQPIVLAASAPKEVPAANPEPVAE